MKFVKYILCLFVLAGIISCSAGNKYTEFTTNDKSVTLSFKKGFKKTSSNTEADLQCVSRDNAVQMVFFVYRKMDLSEGVNSRILLDLQIEDMESKRSEFTKIEEEEYFTGDKHVLRAVYSAVKDDLYRDYYVFSAVDFNDSEQIVLTSLQIVPVSRYSADNQMLKDIINSARVNKEAV